MAFETTTLFCFGHEFHPFQFYKSYLVQSNTDFEILLGESETLKVHLQIFQLSVPQIFTEDFKPHSTFNLNTLFPCNSERYRRVFKNVIIPLIYGVRDVKVFDLIPTLQILSQLKLHEHVDHVISNIPTLNSRLIIQMLRDSLVESQQMQTPENIRDWVIQTMLNRIISLSAIDLAHNIHNPTIISKILSQTQNELSPRYKSDLVISWFRAHRNIVQNDTSLYQQFSKLLPPYLNIQWSTIRDAHFVLFLARNYNDDFVLRSAACFIAKRINLLNPAQILNLPVDIFRMLIDSNDLFVENEDVVYQLVMAYISENKEKKNLSQEAINNLISAVRVRYLSDDASVSFFNQKYMTMDLLQKRITEYTLYKQGKHSTAEDDTQSRNCMYFQFHHDFDGDQNGIFYYLGLNANRDKEWKNPSSELSLISIFGSESNSSISIEAKPASREPLSIIFQRPEIYKQDFMCRFSGLHSEDCIFAIELDPKYSIKPTMYSIYFSGNCGEIEDTLGGWILEGSIDPPTSKSWVTLRRHNASIGKNFFGWKTWSLPQSKAKDADSFFRYFRVRFYNPSELVHVDLLSDSSEDENSSRNNHSKESANDDSQEENDTLLSNIKSIQLSKHKLQNAELHDVEKSIQEDEIIIEEKDIDSISSNSLSNPSLHSSHNMNSTTIDTPSKTSKSQPHEEKLHEETPLLEPQMEDDYSYNPATANTVNQPIESSHYSITQSLNHSLPSNNQIEPSTFYLSSIEIYGCLRYKSM